MFSQLNSPPRLYPCLRFTESLAVSAQDSGPSGSLILSRKNFAFSASCRFSPGHNHRHSTENARNRYSEFNALFTTPGVATLEQQENPRRRRRQESLAVLTQYEQPLR